MRAVLDVVASVPFLKRISIFPRNQLLLYFAITAGTLFRIILPFVHNPLDHIWSDPGRWWEYATKTGIETPPLSLIDPVLYQAWLSFWAKLTLDIPVLVAIYAGALSAVTPWIWYRFLRELIANKTLSLIGWTILAWLPSWIGIYSYFMTETLLLPLLGCALWSSWRALRKQTIGPFVLSSLLWVLASLTRGAVSPIAAVVMFFVLAKQNNRWMSFFVGTCLVATLLSLSGYRNYTKSGVFAPLGQPFLNYAYSISGKASIEVYYHSSRKPGLRYVYGFSSPSIDNEIFSPFSKWTSSRRGTLTMRIDLDNQQSDWNRALSELDSSGVSNIGLRWENFILLMFGPSWPDTNPAHFIEWLSTLLRFAWFPLFLFALAVLGSSALGREKQYLPLFAAIIAWTAVQGFMLISVNEGRYRKPVEGLVIATLLVAADRKRCVGISRSQTICI